ncbi:VOC family protein [Echinicola sediminis]
MEAQNSIVWFEIYVDNMERAGKFYEKVMQVKLEDMSDPNNPSIKMKGFPGNMEGYGASGALVKMDEMKPGGSGTLVYFGCEDCAKEESRVEGNGGKILQAKMSIGEYGFISLALDTEGNTIGFHSRK